MTTLSERFRLCVPDEDAFFRSGFACAWFVLLTAALFGCLRTLGLDTISRAAPCLGAAAALYLVYHRNNFFFVLLLFACSLGASLLAAACFFDVSYDGSTYHQTAIAEISHFYSTFYGSYADGYGTLTIFYPKLAWLYRSAFYTLTGNIHTGISINLMLILSVFFIGLKLFRHYGQAGRLLFSLALACNPIAINQFFSGYVDGNLASFLAWAIAGYYALLTRCLNPRQSALLLFTGLLGMAALKFTGLIFAIIILFFYLATLYLRFRQSPATASERQSPSASATTALYDTSKTAGHISGIGWKPIFVSAFMAFFLLFNPYITNMLHGHHIFHPSMGKERDKQLLADQTRPEFYRLGHFTKIIISLFSQTSTHHTQASTAYPSGKIPFTLYPEEISAIGEVDARAGGWGPLFGGIFLITLILFLCRFEHFKNQAPLLLLLLLLSVIAPTSWWARFNPQMEILVIFTLAAVAQISPARNLAACCVLLLLCANSLIIFESVRRVYLQRNASFSMITHQLQQQSADNTLYLKKPLTVQIHFILDRLAIPYQFISADDDRPDLQCSQWQNDTVCIKR